MPRAGRYPGFCIRQGSEAPSCIGVIRALNLDSRMVVGLVEPLVGCCSATMEGLRPVPALSGPGIEIPSTPHALWCWLRGDDHGELDNRSNALSDSLASAFDLQDFVDAFRFDDGDLGLDLTGYDDGTETPTGDHAVNTTIVNSHG